jgi:hypothetical protein
MRAFLKFDGEGETGNIRRSCSGESAAVGLTTRVRIVPPGTIERFPGQGSAEPARRSGWLRSVREACRLSGRAQRRLHLLVALGRRGEGQSDHAVHLSGVPRHRRSRASGRGRPVASARAALLERRVPERHRRSEILEEGNARADPCAISGGASRSATAAAADLQGAVSRYRRNVPASARGAEDAISSWSEEATTLGREIPKPRSPPIE